MARARSGRLGIPLLLASWSILLLSACLPSAATPLPPTPTGTPLPPTSTPTTTPVWFPPTPTSTLFPTPYISPTLDLRPQFGALMLKDDFSSPADWGLGRSRVGTAALGKHELSLAVSEPGGYLASLHQNTTPDDFYAEVTASPSLCRSSDEYGLVFRATPGGDFYRFALTCAGQARVDRLLRSVPAAIQAPVLSGAVPPGAPSTSRLALLVQGAQFSFYVNGEFLFTVRDPSLPSGQLGMFARSQGVTAVTVNFSDLAIYAVK